MEMYDLVVTSLLIIISILIGTFIGRFGTKHFKLGKSAILFVGLLISYFYLNRGGELIDMSVLFKLSLVLFITPVGLEASKKMKGIITNYGFKFIILSLVVTVTGSVFSLMSLLVFKELSYEIIGSYVGALTSSPGLATALEMTEVGTESFIGLGYAVAYIPGVISVIMFAQLTLNPVKEKQQYTAKQVGNTNFNWFLFLLVICLGWSIGQIRLGGLFSLGLTGGVLLSSLVVGSKLTKEHFSSNALKLMKNIALSTFLSIVGLKYGYSAINLLMDSGLTLFLIGLICANVSIYSGYLIGLKVLKMDKPVLVGAICGAMTSTPGLGAATDISSDEKITAGYGATYPVALLSMIVLTRILFALV